FFDMNNDNWPDLYIAQDKSQGNTLLLHQGTENSFLDISVAASANLIMNAMGIAIGDYNCDGWQDLYISNTPHGNALLVNDQMGGFIEQAEATGTTFNGTAWGTHFLDADNDGFEDLYVSGMAVGTDVVSSAFYYNDQQGSFYVDEAGFVGDTVSSFGNAIGDYNNDGNLDILVVNTTTFPAQLWSNEGASSQSYLKIQLEGIISNREGIGARVDLYNEGHYQIRYRHGGMGYLGQNSSRLHFGVGESPWIDSLTVTWPTGHVDRFYEVVPNQLLDIQEGSSTDGQIMVDNALISEVEHLDEPSIWQLYPNPTRQRIFVRYEANSEGELVIYDLSGQRLRDWRIANGKSEYLLKNLAAGTYIVQLQTAGSSWNRKLVILP
nr:VCBS repeat-containing protein [Saprospiraceae bacterium]